MYNIFTFFTHQKREREREREREGEGTCVIICGKEDFDFIIHYEFFVELEIFSHGAKP